MGVNVLATTLAATFAAGFWGYIWACWILVFATIGVYAALTIARGRRLTRRLPPEDRRWM